MARLGGLGKGLDALIPSDLDRREPLRGSGAHGSGTDDGKSGAEGPRLAELPIDALSSLLTHSYALLAHLAAIRILLSRRGVELDRAQAEAVLQAEKTHIDAVLGTAPLPATTSAGTMETDPPEPPNELSTAALLPWLRRRLTLAGQASARVAEVASTLNGRGTR